jgi:tRNA A37 threonylcarbamoyladenosine synthetase subunit TsaC/SUA5/YrdC
MDNACKDILMAKGRRMDNPLIVHVCSLGAGLTVGDRHTARGR